MTARFVDFPLRIVSPGFDSPLTDVVIELEHLRRLQLAGDTPAQIFFQLKEIFHTLESLGSARIEGNHTTLADYIETKIDGAQDAAADNIQEVRNIEAAMDYLETAIATGDDITEHLIRELHQLTVQNLIREGDQSPGRYRAGGVVITGATHLPPGPESVPMYMEQLVAFINSKDQPKYDLLKMALAHHRFCWIHPFGNGNGRVVRLLSYAMLIKYGFNVRAGGRVLNPTAVFCSDRNAYYANLSAADEGSEPGLIQWCHYVLGGIKGELEKVDNLTRYEFLKIHVLRPALAFSKARKLVTDQEVAILSMAIEKGEFKAADVDTACPKLTPRQRTYQLAKLVEAHLVRPVREGSRTYTINFTNNYLLRGVVQALEDCGFIPPLVRRAQ